MSFDLAKSHLCECLKCNFLYNADCDSLDSLINIYDVNININNFFPVYSSIKKLRNKTESILLYREDRNEIASSLAKLIHEDVNRLELYLYLEGYIKGHADGNSANLLEKYTLKYYLPLKLRSRKFLFQYDKSHEDINNIKYFVFQMIKNEEKKTRRNYSIIFEFIHTVLRDKIYNLNKYVDKQQILKENGIVDSDGIITKEDLNLIYRETFKFILKKCSTLYFDAYWNGVNERVLKRYR